MFNHTIFGKIFRANMVKGYNFLALQPPTPHCSKALRSNWELSDVLPYCLKLFKTAQDEDFWEIMFKIV